MIRSISCGSGSPEAAHIIGNPDVGVIPGMVLISLTTTSPRRRVEEVHPREPLAADRVERRARQRAHPGGRRGGNRRGNLHPRLLGQVLGLEVVPGARAGRPRSCRAPTPRAPRRRAPRARRTPPRRRRSPPRRAPSCRTAVASSMAASSESGPATRDVPIDDPPLAGLTNTGQPSSATSSSTRLRSARGRDGPQSLSRTTTYRPMGSPRAANSSFMYSLSMPAALASTPAPAYLIPAISSSPWIVPSSPKVPCSSGSTTSTSPSSAGTDGGPAEHERPAARPGGGRRPTPRAWRRPPPTAGPGRQRQPRRVAEVSTHRPSRAMPIGTTS